MKTKYQKALLLGSPLFLALTGCVEHPRHQHVYSEPPPVYRETRVLEPTYVYYPQYQVYYSPRNRQYIYQENRSWVSRSAPPRVSVDVLFGSPAVGLEFHDHPSHHHSQVIRRYPRHLTPTGRNDNYRYYDRRKY